MSDLLIAPRGDGSIVLHIPSGTYLQLDASATTVLTLVGSAGADGAATELVRRYGLDRSTADADVVRVVTAIVGAQTTLTGNVHRPTLGGGADVVRQWLGLDTRAKMATARIAVLVAAIELGLRFRPVNGVARRLQVPLEVVDETANRPAATDAPPPTSADTAPTGSRELDPSDLTAVEVYNLGAMDWVLARWIYDATCLRKALAGGWILRHRGPRLRIGLIDQGEVTAHAWLVVDGSTLGALGNVHDFSRLADPGMYPGPA